MATWQTRREVISCSLSKCFQTGSVELDHWREVRAVNVDLKAIDLVIMQSIKANTPKGEKFR